MIQNIDPYTIMWNNTYVRTTDEANVVFYTIAHKQCDIPLKIVWK